MSGWTPVPTFIAMVFIAYYLLGLFWRLWKGETPFRDSYRMQKYDKDLCP